MADNLTIPARGSQLAADDVGGIFYPRTKLSWGIDGSAQDVDLANPMPFQKGQQRIAPAVILNGQSLSAAIDLGVSRLVGIVTPGVLTQTVMSFQASYDGATWNDVYSDGGIEKTATLGAGRRIVLNPSEFYGIRYLKLRTGTSAVPANVTADRTFQLVSEA